jgi:hypothetical protein
MDAETRESVQLARFIHDPDWTPVRGTYIYPTGKGFVKGDTRINRTKLGRAGRPQISSRGAVGWSMWRPQRARRSALGLSVTGLVTETTRR